jgi:midasin
METPRKRRKVEESGLRVSEEDWVSFVRDVEEFEVQHVQGQGKFAFGFVEGPLVKALRAGDWLVFHSLRIPRTII